MTQLKEYHYDLFQIHLVKQIKEEKDPLKYDFILFNRIFSFTLSIFSFKANASYFFVYISSTRQVILHDKFTANRVWMKITFQILN